MRSVYLVGVLLCVVAITQAAAPVDFRGGFVQWRSTGTNKVDISVYTAWTTSARGSVSIDLGDGTVVPSAIGAETVVFTANDNSGKPRFGYVFNTL